MADGVGSSQFVVKQSSLKKNSHQDGSSVKMLINEMCNREHHERGRPGVVARLMGMDTLTQKTGPTIHPNECFDENSMQEMSVCEITKVGLSSIPLTEEKSPLNPILSTRSLSSVKPYRR